MIRRILHATDFSSASRPAFAKAVQLAQAYRADLILAHVLAPTLLVAADGYSSASMYREMQAAARQQARKHLAALVDKGKRMGVSARVLLIEGGAADRIVRAARTQRADMIVIGTHGRTGFTRLLLGSVAQGVVSRARCPVLTIRGR